MIENRLLSLLSLLLLLGITFSVSAPANNDLLETVGGIEDTKIVKTDFSGNGETQMQFRYLKIPPRVKTSRPSPTVVLLSGGPMPTLQNAAQRIREFPEGSPLIFLDYRGFGANQLMNQKNFQGKEEQFFNSDLMAQDVLAVLRQELITDFILVGQSFGAIVATKVASISPLSPAAVILEGTPHTSFARAEVEAAVAAFNDSLISNMPEQTRKHLRTLLPLEFSQEHWLRLLDEMAVSGPATFSQKVSEIFEIHFNGTDHEKGLLKKQLRPQATFTTPNLTSQILLSEIYQQIHDIQWVDDHFEVWESIDASEQFSSPPFHSGKYKITSPVYYLQGDSDLRTPELSARKHFAQQTTSPLRQFIQLPGSGHKITSHLKPDTLQAFWKAVLSRSFVPHHVFPESNMVNKTPNSCDQLLAVIKKQKKP